MWNNCWETLQYADINEHMMRCCGLIAETLKPPIRYTSLRSGNFEADHDVSANSTILPGPFQSLRSFERIHDAIKNITDMLACTHLSFHGLFVDDRIQNF